MWLSTIMIMCIVMFYICGRLLLCTVGAVTVHVYCVRVFVCLQDLDECTLLHFSCMLCSLANRGLLSYSLTFPRYLHVHACTRCVVLFVWIKQHKPTQKEWRRCTAQYFLLAVFVPSTETPEEMQHMLFKKPESAALHDALNCTA